MTCCTPSFRCWARSVTFFPWRSAFSSHPSKSTLYTLFPPLLLQPNVSFCSPRPLPNVARNTFIPKRPCYVTDLASQDKSLLSQIPVLSTAYGNNRPPSALDKFAFRGASFGHMIFSSNRSCFLFDVFTGIDVSPPPGAVRPEDGVSLAHPKARCACKWRRVTATMAPSFQRRHGDRRRHSGEFQPRVVAGVACMNMDEGTGTQSASGMVRPRVEEVGGDGGEPRLSRAPLHERRQCRPGAGVRR
ncbi:hypothetical protein C2845_PM09G00630 [Panicum miliaceum]|uniref:Uncharacterized protein n=1 Tax=Panicum miliaceum TaxID=4540 RepID=A0A3L6S2L9_PANMI|nr:hypothetical protein C2845_PM09G00630 [Panicum miliaceum]